MGGGIYESEIFYELCDSLGLLIWQDFMFACAAYPEHESFLNNVREEIEQNIHLLQYHPSIALWCGNNENEWIWHQENNRDVKDMPGYNIFHQLVPGIIQMLDPFRPYWPSSPFGVEENPNDFKSGNRHNWDIWSNWVDYTEVIDDLSLFVTEFGFQAPANLSTIQQVLTEYVDNAQNDLFEFHNKQIEGPERLYKFLAGHLPVKTQLSDFIYLTQLNQAFALKTCLEHWRISSPKTKGSIIWQLNDCWPVCSWSLIDSNLHRKLAYYFVKNAFDPIAVYCVEKGGMVEFIIINETTIDAELKLIIKRLKTKTGACESVVETIKNIKANTTLISYRIPISKNLQNGSEIILASIYDLDNNLLCRNYFITKRWKHINLPEASPNILIEDNNKSLQLRSDGPLFFLSIYHPKLDFSENGLIILPDEVIHIKKLEDQKISLDELKIFSLNNYLCKKQ